MTTTYWSGRSVLVTGANGFIGSNLVDALVLAGAKVVALVRDLKPQGGLRLLELETKVTVVLGSITDAALVERVIAQYQIQDCFHLAAQALVGTARTSPADTFDSNVRGTWTLLDACRRRGVGAVIVASSDKAYGSAARLPYVETDPLLARNPYDVSKACAEMLARSFSHSFGLPIGITRCANVYGRADVNSSRLFPDVILSAIAGRPVRLRSDGTHLRDFLYVDDAVSAYLTLAEQIGRPDVQGEAFNFGTGTPHRVIDVVRAILALMDRSDLQPIIEDRVGAGEEIPAQYTDSSKAIRLLGWSPAVQFDEGLRRTIAWYRDFARKRAEEEPSASVRFPRFLGLEARAGRTGG